MPRPRRFTDDQVLDAARDLLADPAISRPSIAQIGRRAGIHTGSIYLRFPSRDELLARLWLRSVRRFQEGIVQATRGPDPLLTAALHQPTYCREHPTEARAMQMFHREELLQIGPDELRRQIEHVNDELNSAVVDAARAGYGDDLTDEGVQWVMMAVKAIPYGLIRGYIAQAAPIPDWIDDIVRTATGSVLQSGRVPGRRIVTQSSDS